MFAGSKKILLDIIKRHGSVTMDEITAQTDLSKTTFREHLMQLERDGYIRRKYLRSGPGRPKLSYELTTSGHRLFPSSESELLRGLLRYLKAEGNDEMIEKFFENYWDERLEKAREKLRKIPRGGIRVKIEALCEMLEEEGFMPEIEIESNTGSVSGSASDVAADVDSEIDSDVGSKNDGVAINSKEKNSGRNVSGFHQTIKIRECNCPFSQAIRETRLPCKLEAIFFEKLFHKKIERTSYIADGEHACTYEFKIQDQ